MTSRGDVREAAVEVAADYLFRAIEHLQTGGLVALPTETVYGLAADARDGEAVARIFEAKGRPQFNPLIIHVNGRAMAEAIGVFDPVSAALAEQFWPGPLTLVLPLAENAPVHPLALAGLETVAIRQPIGPAAVIIAALRGPIAAPSANRSGRVSPTTAEAVRQDLGARVDYILDGGPTAVGVESTIVKVEGEAVRLLRHGGVTREEIEAFLGRPVEDRSSGEATVEAPGMLASHYAPRAGVRLTAVSAGSGEALLAFGPVPSLDSPDIPMLNLSATGDLREAAANLFGYLRALDHLGVRTIAVMPVPTHGLGAAINDRLARAAAPRSI